MLGPDSAPSKYPKTDSLPNERGYLSIIHGAWLLTCAKFTYSESCSRGMYDPHQQLIAITKQRGKLLHRMGIQKGATLFLRLEEAMYLLERNLLVVESPTAGHKGAATIMELQHLMEAAGIPIEAYTVYKELMAASLIVSRHPAQWTSGRAGQATPAETKVPHILEGLALPPAKRLKPTEGSAGFPLPAASGPMQSVHRTWWPAAAVASDAFEASLHTAEAAPDSIGECRLPDRPNLKPFRACPLPPESSMTPQRSSLAYDVYKASSQFSKKNPQGLCMQVHMSQSRPPSRDAMCAAEAGRRKDESIFHATAADSHVAMYSFSPVCLPDLFQGVQLESMQDPFEKHRPADPQ